MSGSGYWASLWGVGIFIFFGFLCLFGVAAALAFLFDRGSVLEIWNSPVWTKIKVPLIILGVIGFVAGVFAFARYQGQKEMQAAREYALARGWDFSLHDTQGLTARAGEILWDFKNMHLYYIRTVETGQRSLYLFDCSYNYKERQ